MSLHIAAPRRARRRPVKGTYLGLAAGVLVVAGAAAGAISLRSTSHSARTARASTTPIHVTAFPGAGRTDTMGGYADYLQSRPQAVASADDHTGGYAEYLHDSATATADPAIAAELSDLANLQQQLLYSQPTTVDPSVAAELSDLANLQQQLLNNTAQPAGSTESVAAPSVASQIEGPGPHFIPGPSVDETGAADTSVVVPATPETPR